jgi:hypothetical protein
MVKSITMTVSVGGRKKSWQRISTRLRYNCVPPPYNSSLVYVCYVSQEEAPRRIRLIGLVTISQTRFHTSFGIG